MGGVMFALEAWGAVSVRGLVSSYLRLGGEASLGEVVVGRGGLAGRMDRREWLWAAWLGVADESEVGCKAWTARSLDRQRRL